MVRVWKFLMPETGEHTLKVKSIGTSKQSLTLDGAVIESREGQTVFSGPGGCILRLKKGSNQWTLLVDERQVEEVGTSADGIRDLRSMTEGSYTIATGFSSAGIGIKKHTCRKFNFFVDSTPHEVVVAHKDRVWHVSLDGLLVDREKHSLLESTGKVEFDVPAADGLRIPAMLEMAWSLVLYRWNYSLHVGDVLVPVSWTNFRGKTRGLTPPVVHTGAAPPETAAFPSLHESAKASPEGKPAEAAGDTCPAEDTEIPDTEISCPDSLPQGVSYDREAGAFQAIIKDTKMNRFVLLGEFATVDEAHQKYLEELPRYAPERKLAPAVV